MKKIVKIPKGKASQDSVGKVDVLRASANEETKLPTSPNK
jgi:hypothetical protein